MIRILFICLALSFCLEPGLRANPDYLPAKKIELRSRDIVNIHQQLEKFVDWIKANKTEILTVMSNNKVSVKQRLELKKKQTRFMKKIGIKNTALFWSKIIAIKNAVMYQKVSTSGLNSQMRQLYSSQKQMVIADKSLSATEKKERLKEIERSEASLSYLENPDIPQQNLRIVKKYKDRVAKIIELTKQLNPSMMN